MIVVCGEALMDVFAGADTASGLTLDARVGGSPFNVAVGLSRLTQPVAFLGAISRDFLGARLLRVLDNEGVVTEGIVRVDAPTTLGLVGLDAEGVPAYAFYGDGGADRQLGPDDVRRAFDAFHQSADSAPQALHLGSLATVVEPVATSLRALVEHVRGDLLISFDPNVRLGVEPDPARWRATLRWMLSRTHLLKISEEDLARLEPDTHPLAFCAHALAQGVRLVVVTRGPAGALACNASASAQVAAIDVPLVDTVGAGDSFQAALLAWLADHDQFHVDALAALDAAQLGQALRFAVRAAAITCSRRGADLPRLSEVEP
ncbi:MAG: carbohydrate kinase [Variovorax sp.]